MKHLFSLIFISCATLAEADPVVHNGRLVELERGKCKIVQPFDREGFSKVTWSGECLNERAHGDGEAEFTFRDGWFSSKKAIYYGEMIDGQRHGYGETEAKGVFAGEDLTHYRGDYRNGLRHGIGRLYIQGPDGKTFEFEGSFQYSEAIGYGELVFTTEEYVAQAVGEFKDYKPHGYAEMQVQPEKGARATYEGYFQNGRMHGYGVYTKGGRVYEGEFVNGCLPKESLTDMENALIALPKLFGLGDC